MSEYVGLIHCDGKLEIVAYDGSLERLHSLVGGYIEHLPTFTDAVHLLVNEDGKLLGLKPNSTATLLCPFLLGNDILVGDVVMLRLTPDKSDFCGWDSEDVALHECRSALVGALTGDYDSDIFDDGDAVTRFANGDEVEIDDALAEFLGGGIDNVMYYGFDDDDDDDDILDEIDEYDE